MRRLTWWAQYLTSRLGWPGLAGGVMMLVSGGVHWGILTKEVTRQNDLRAASLVMTSNLRERQNQPATLNGAELLTRFTEALPASTAQQRTDAIAKMQSAALAEGVALQEASFLESEAAGQPFDSLEMVLPVNGNYVQLRRFIARALSANPALALEGVTFNRQSVSEATLEAQLRFTLYMQRP